MCRQTRGRCLRKGAGEDGAAAGDKGANKELAIFRKKKGFCPGWKTNRDSEFSKLFVIPCLEGEGRSKKKGLDLLLWKWSGGFGGIWTIHPREKAGRVHVTSVGTVRKDTRRRHILGKSHLHQRGSAKELSFQNSPRAVMHIQLSEGSRLPTLKNTKKPKQNEVP